MSFSSVYALGRVLCAVMIRILICTFYCQGSVCICGCYNIFVLLIVGSVLFIVAGYIAYPKWFKSHALILCLKGFFCYKKGGVISFFVCFLHTIGSWFRILMYNMKCPRIAIENDNRDVPLTKECFI